MAGRFPFRGFPPEAIIWNVAKGRRQSLKDLKCNANLKVSILETHFDVLPPPLYLV